MLAHIRLHEQLAVARVQATGQVERCKLSYGVVQLFRIYWHRERVQVNNAEDVIVVCLRFLPVA